MVSDRGAAAAAVAGCSAMSREFSVDIAPTVRSGTQPTAPVVPSVTGKLPALQSRSTISEFSNRQESPCTLATSAGTRARSTTNSLSPVVISGWVGRAARCILGGWMLVLWGMSVRRR